jgi:phosphatidylethanolamine-binding protein (PEBP) family uncharacterized protein
MILSFSVLTKAFSKRNLIHNSENGGNSDIRIPVSFKEVPSQEKSFAKNPINKSISTK